MIKSLLIIALIFAIGLVGLSINVSAEERMIPSWIKNNAAWWTKSEDNSIGLANSSINF